MVALRKESVDRNVNLRVVDGSKSSVALRKESVDRNRRHEDGSLRLDTVALRKESVDRNFYCSGYFRFSRLSLSARRAWIEIMGRDEKSFGGRKVALRKESVDRNIDEIQLEFNSLECRSPQGERG